MVDGKNFATRNPGAGQGFIAWLRRPACGIRLRVAILSDGHVWVANFDSEVPALNRREHGANPWQPTISASVVKLLSSSASNGEFAGGSPAGCTNLFAILDLRFTSRGQIVCGHPDYSRRVIRKS